MRAVVLSRALRVRHALFVEDRGLCEPARPDAGRGPHLPTLWTPWSARTWLGIGCLMCEPTLWRQLQCLPLMAVRGSRGPSLRGNGLL